MRESNKSIELEWNEAISILSELEILLISLHKMGAYYGELMIDDEKLRSEYEKETTRFIDESLATSRLSKIRGILSSKFDNTLGSDDMDDIERALQFLDTEIWRKPGDTPKSIIENDVV